MADRTTIGWTNRTHNTWEGCARKSRGCRFCYAANVSKRYAGEDAPSLWRAAGPRKFRSDEYWRKPLKWEREAAKQGYPLLVFCASMADVFERHPDPEINARMDIERARLWQLIEDTPNLIWQLLTKRPENVNAMVPWTAESDPHGWEWPDNVWVGASVEHQACAVERVPLLLDIPAKVRFLSVEPMVGPVDLGEWLVREREVTDPELDAPDGALVDGMLRVGDRWHRRYGLDWIICGGESGALSKVDRMAPEWVRDLRHQARLGDIPFFFKQTGSVLAKEWGLTGKGDRADEWPTDWLFPQEFPAAYEYARDAATVGV